MGLKGNLGSVDLANIFQMLSINQKEGTLIIYDGQSRKSIYFSRDGVSMLSRGKVRQDSLGRILLRYNRITPDQLQRALEKQHSSNRLLGEILEEMGVVSRTDVENALRVQIEEEIYNLFVWKNAEFEFVEGDPKEVFDDLERPITKLTFNVNALIMEAARRIDEWEYISARITSTRDIFRFTGKRADLSDEVFQTPFADKVLQCVDGRSNVLEIVERSYVNKFEVCKLLALLLEQGALEPVPVEDLKALAADAAREGNDEETVKFLQRILDYGDLDAELHLGLAQAFENLGELEKAACHHKLYAECRLEEGDAAEAVRAYSHVTEILPTDLCGRERRLQVLLENAPKGSLDRDEVITEARAVAGILAEIGQVRKAVGVLARAVSLVPDDLEARQQLATLDLQAGFTTEAITEYRHIAAVRRAQNDLEGAAKIYRKVLAIDRSQQAVIEELESLVTVRRRRSAQRRRILLTALVTILAGVAVYAVLLYEFRARGTLLKGEVEAKALFASHDLVARKTLGRVQSELAGFRVRAEPDPVARLEDARRLRSESEKAIQTVRALYEDVIERFPYSSCRRQAAEKIQELDDLRNEVDKLERAARERVQAQAEDAYRVGLELSSGGRLTPALDRFREALRLATDPDWITSPGIDLRERIHQHEIIIEEARETTERAQALEAEGRLDESVDLLLGLLKTHAFQEILEQIRLPVEITSRPSDAAVLGIDEPARRTPTVAHWTPWLGLSGSLEAPGFDATPFELPQLDLSERIEEIRSHVRTRIHVDLRKGFRWRTAVGAAIQSAPLLEGDTAYVGSRGGRLLAVRAGDGEVLWSLDLPTLGGVTTTPVRWNGLLIVATSNPNALLAVDSRERRIVWRYDADGKLGPVVAPPVILGPSLLVADQTGVVARLDLEGGLPRTRWRTRPGGEVRGRLVGHGETILVPSLDGNIYELELERGRARRRIRVGSPVTGTPLLAEERLLVPSADGSLRAIDLGTEEIVWSVRTAGDLRSAPAVAGHRVAFGALDGVLRVVELDTGAPIAEFRTGGPLPATPLVAGDQIFVTSHDGRVYALSLAERELSLLWHYATGARITAEPLGSDGTVLVASEDGYLYSLTP